VCALLLLFNAYLFNDLPTTRPLRWLCAIIVGILGLWVVWTGSRTSVLTTAVGLLFMYRLRLGRLALLGLAAGAVVVAVMGFFEESTEQISRLTSGQNTRAAVWANSLDAFMASPIFGTMPLGYESGSESSYISALANMGLIGGLALLIPFGSMALGAMRALRLRVLRPDLGAQCDLYVGLAAAMVVINGFEAFAFGVLTLPVMVMYSMFALDGFLAEQEALASSGYGLTAEDTDYAYA
jgi:O-antigen ligase